MTARRLWAIRHAPTLAEGRCVGASDVPTLLTPETAATRMVEQIPSRVFRTVWTSPRSRCAEPARLLASALSVPVQVDDRLDELSFGAWEGRAWSEIQTKDPASYAEWLAHWTAVAPPGGERLNAFAARVRSWWHDVSPGDHALVAHAGVVRALRVIANGDDWTGAMSAPVVHLTGEWIPTSGTVTA